MPTSTSVRVRSFDEDEDDDEDEKPESVGVLDTAATFDELLVWGHELVPTADDPFVKGVEEWIAFAEAVSGCHHSICVEADGRSRFTVNQSRNEASGH